MGLERCAEQIKGILNRRKKVFQHMSDSIWEFAEFRFQEFKSCAIQKEFLQNEGFRITENLAEMETAFMAEWGEDGPLIGILGEFDALPSLSQKCDSLKPESRDGYEYGHGCGHHLLGTAAVEAAVVVRDYLKENNMKGRIRYYATPAEEGAAAKTFMLREGCFLDLDICISWHPDTMNTCGGSTLSMIRTYFDFHGKSAHAALAPHLGRSALDAVELMNVGCNYLREHVIPEARFHYAVTNTGGPAPNTVQSEAQVCYNVRAPKNGDMVDIYERICCVAQGAAMMTGTTVDIRPVSYYANYLDNAVLNRVTSESMAQIVDDHYTQEELDYARKFQTVLSPESIKRAKDNALHYAKTRNEDVINSPVSLYTCPVGMPKPASTDLGNVSWNVPTICFSCTCFAAGTALHSWQAVAQGKSALAHHGMHNAAAVMALSAIRLFEDQELIVQAKENFKVAKGGEEYHCILPEYVKPGDF